MLDVDGPMMILPAASDCILMDPSTSEHVAEYSLH